MRFRVFVKLFFAPGFCQSGTTNHALSFGEFLLARHGANPLFPYIVVRDKSPFILEKGISWSPMLLILACWCCLWTMASSTPHVSAAGMFVCSHRRLSKRFWWTLFIRSCHLCRWLIWMLHVMRPSGWCQMLLRIFLLS